MHTCKPLLVELVIALFHTVLDRSKVGLEHGGCRQPMCDLEGCATVLGVVPPPPLVDPHLGGRQVELSAAGLPRGEAGWWVPQHHTSK